MRNSADNEIAIDNFDRFTDLGLERKGLMLMIVKRKKQKPIIPIAIILVFCLHYA